MSSARDEMRRQQERAERRAKRTRRLILIFSGTVIAGLIIAIVTVGVRSSRSPDTAGTASASVGSLTPASATKDGALPVGDAKAPVTVQLYLDYMCPYCGQFERANSPDLKRLVEAGKVRLEIHPLSFLDPQSNGARYSTRAANAVAAVADRASGSLLAFNAALFAQQPEEGSSGLSDERIASLASESGVPREVIDSFTRLSYTGWVASATKLAFDSGITGTPTVKINGTVFKGNLYTAGPLALAIEQAGAVR